MTHPEIYVEVSEILAREVAYCEFFIFSGIHEGLSANN